MDTQIIIVYAIVACAVAAVVRYVYRQIRGKGRGCHCGDCPMHGDECHCHDTQK